MDVVRGLIWSPAHTGFTGKNQEGQSGKKVFPFKTKTTSKNHYKRVKFGSFSHEKLKEAN